MARSPYPRADAACVPRYAPRRGNGHVNPLSSIKNRILAFAIVATLVPAVGLGLLTFWRYERVIDDNAAFELLTATNYVRSELSLWARERAGELRVLATSNTVVDGLTERARPGSTARRIGPREIETYLRAVQAKLGLLLELSVFDEKGERIASSATTPTPVALPAVWPERSIVEGVIAAPPARDAARRTTTVVLVVPVVSFGSERLGALAAVVDLGSLEPRLAQVADGTAGEVVLTAPDGRPLLGSRGGVDAMAALPVPVLADLQARQGRALEYTGHRGREVMGVANAPGPLSVIVVAERELDEVHRSWLRALQLYAGLVAALTVVVGLVAFWMGRSIVLPLGRLTGAAQRIAGDDLSVELQPVGSGEVASLTRSFQRMVERLRDSRAQVQASNQALQRQNELLEKLAVTDALTGVYNRKKLDDVLREQMALYRRHQRRFALLMLDIDHFKILNDSYGHLVGDIVLTTVASLLRRAVRSVDHVARYGGEEFVVVLVEATPQGALETAERIRALLAATEIDAGGTRVRVTASLGVTECVDEDRRAEDVLGRADSALYEAKRGGRNRVHCAFAD